MKQLRKGMVQVFFKVEFCGKSDQLYLFFEWPQFENVSLNSDWTDEPIAQIEVPKLFHVTASKTALASGWGPPLQNPQTMVQIRKETYIFGFFLSLLQNYYIVYHKNFINVLKTILYSYWKLKK